MTYRDNEGNITRATTNSLGHTTYVDSKGKRTTCRKNSIGQTICN